jgi:Predicted choline kinase involved in LPS biosynthesis
MTPARTRGEPLPVEVLRALRNRIGAIDSVSPLGGLSGRTVAVARGQRGTLVAKGPAAATEVRVATRLAPLFREAGIRVAESAVVRTANAGQWLVLEYLPQALPRDRWGADADVIDVLRALHSLRTEPIARIRRRFRPRWDASLTTAAVTALHGGQDLVDRIVRLSERCQYLFDPLAVVSADPNPLNWRLDAAGSPVLIDWERLTLGHPAIDLGILLPGLGEPREAERVANRYGSRDVTATDILRAKAWSLVELAASAPAGGEAAAMIRSLRDDIIDRLATVSLIRSD